MEYDTKIVGGTIVDGTGRERFLGDVGINNGRIAAVGNARGDARETIDAGGLVIAPGVIDPHTHYDAQVLWDRSLSISPWHGVTTTVMGNCGFGIAPTRSSDREYIVQTLEVVEGMSANALRTGLGDWGFESFEQYLALLQARGTAANVALYVGHSPIRIHVMGEEAFEREASAEEIQTMRALVRSALEAGAIGFSTSGSRSHVGFRGKPVPSRLANFEETRALAAVMGEMGRGVFQATVGPNMFYEQFEAIYADSGRPITWTALLTGFWGPGSHQHHLDKLTEYRDRGVPIVPQVACRPIVVEFSFADPAPFLTREFFKPVAQADAAGRAAIYADAAFRAKFKAEYGPQTVRQLTNWAARAVISAAPGHQALDETPLAEEARRRGVDPVDAALDLALETNLMARYRIAMSNNLEDEVAEVLGAAGTLIALSDAGAHASQLCDAPYATHLLGHWVREKGAMTLEDAVARLTSQPADLFGFADRGRLERGKAADIMIFDPTRVAAAPLRRVRDLPAGEDRLVSDAIGMHLVMVNGKVLRKDGKDQLSARDALPGLLLTGRAAAG